MIVRIENFALTQFSVNDYIVTMTSWIPAISARPGPRYLAIADTLAADIAAGRLKPGDRLPTHRDLAWRLHVTVGTVTRAYAEAERRGLIAGEVGRGTFIRERIGDAPQTMPAAPATTDDYVDLSRNLPAVTGPAAQMIAKHLADMAREDLAPFLSYAPNHGLPAHREAGAEWMARRGVAANPARVAVVSGAQNAMMLTVAAIARPGDVVLTEALTFYGMKSVANLLGVRLIGVELDDDGLIPEALEAQCRQHAPKAIYALPTFQNPTTSLMPLERRKAVVEICRRYNVTVIEDDIYGFLDETNVPLCVLAPEIGVFVTSLSKCVAPGMRLGYVHAPEAIAMRISAAIRASTYMTSPMVAELAARLIRSGDTLKAAQYQKALAERRQRLAGRLLARQDFVGHPSASQIWLKLPEPWRREEFTDAARKRGVGVAPANAFAIGRAPVPHAVRLALAAPQEDAAVERALDTLVEILDEPPIGSLRMV
jgi:DNA-binding transcriptional MocR family regulator